VKTASKRRKPKRRKLLKLLNPQQSLSPHRLRSKRASKLLKPLNRLKLPRPHRRKSKPQHRQPSLQPRPHLQPLRQPQLQPAKR
jgi:hypothetical protein